MITESVIAQKDDYEPACRKIFVMPKEGSMNGTLVIDGSWDSNLVEENLVLQIENGLVMDISGGDLAVRIKNDFLNML